jgi:drug/metabolite transporter (DMT)-like permease
MLPANRPLLVRCSSKDVFASTQSVGSVLMAVLLALAAALGWGTADFVGGVSRRTTSVLVIVTLSELLGLAALVPVLVARDVALPDGRQLLLAGIAGVGVTVELGLIYFALSRGEAFITATVGAAGAAIAAAAGLIGGDPLDLTIAIGLLCAVTGGAFTALGSSSNGGAAHSLAICAVAAAGVATMLICFHAAGRGDPYWATATEHASTAASAGLIAAVAGRGRPRDQLPKPGQLPALALVALTGVGGDLAYAAASRQEALSIVSAISSLYPIATIALGMLLQSRKPGRLQAIGIILALIGAVALGAAE